MNLSDTQNSVTQVQDDISNGHASSFEMPNREDDFLEVNTSAFLQDLQSSGKRKQRAFEKLVQFTHDKLAHFLGRHLNNTDCIQEALQETYLGVYRGLPSFESKCKLTTWIYSLAYRKACDILAQKYRRKEVDLSQKFEDGEMDFHFTQEMSIDETYEQGQLVNEIIHASKNIPKIYREAFQLRDIDGLSGEEAAIVLGISFSLIRVRLHRARSLIVNELRQKIPTLFMEGFVA